MEKLLNLINWPAKAKKYSNPEEPASSTLPPKISLPKKDGPDEATRPVYRIGKRKPADFQKGH